MQNLRARVRKWMRLLVRRQAVQRKASAAILMYHSINDPWHPAIVPFNIVSPGNFARQMRRLARRYRVVSLETLVGELRTGQLPPGRTVALTFDDGYKDNFTHAFSILQRYGLTGTFFLATGCIDNHSPKWDDSLSLLLASTSAPDIEVPIGNQMIALPLRNRSDRWKTLSLLITHLRLLSAAEREDILAQLMARYAGAASLPPPDIMLSWEDVKVMAHAGMTFGAHTIHHVSLPTLDEHGAIQEVMGSKQTIESHTRQTITCFSYPFGKSADFSPMTQAILRANGFICSVTSVSGINTPGQDLFTLERIAVGDEDNLLDWELKILDD